MPRIHPLAVVDPAARIADDAEIGPFCIIGPQVEIGAGCRLISNVTVDGDTRIGARTVIYPNCSLGGPPQSVAYRGEPTRLVIGEDCDLREGVTMNRGTASGGGVTTVGSNGMFMVGAHVAHDCHVGNNVIFANCATLAGHCMIGDHVFIGGLSAVLQHSRVGAQAMIGGMTGVRADIIPFGMAYGPTARLAGINVVGMRRRKFSRESIEVARSVFRVLFRDPAPRAEVIERIAEEFSSDPAGAEIIGFLQQNTKRPLCRPGRQIEE